MPPPKIRADRPHMPEYGIAAANAGRGLLPWSWAEKLLISAMKYWLVTTSADGPHAMPVWCVWSQGALWLSTGGKSRKARNLKADARCVVAPEVRDATLVLHGRARRVPPARIPRAVFTAYARKYPPWKLDPNLGPVFAVKPSVVLGWKEDFEAEGFTKTATRWKLN